MGDAYLARIVEAAAALKIKGEPVSIRSVARVAGVHHKSVWRRWSKLDVYELEEPKVEAVRGDGLHERHDEEVQIRVDFVRAAKATLPMLEGVAPEVLDEILTYDERTLEMAKQAKRAQQAKQYDRVMDDWSIGCIDEDDRTPTRLMWTPDGRTRPAPIRDGRRHYATGRQYVGCVSNPPPRKAVEEKPVLSFTQQAVRDYRRAWRRIAG